MDAAALKQMQAPFKQRYRDEPEAAVITLAAEGAIGEGVTCSVQTAKALVEAGLHPATGGSGASACSGDMLLEALAACAGVTLNAVATALEIPLRSGRVRAEGDLDFRGTLGVAKDAPVGFKDIRLSFELESDATEEQLATLIKLTERYCVVYQTLRNPPPVAVARGAALSRRGSRAVEPGLNAAQRPGLSLAGAGGDRRCVGCRPRAGSPHATARDRSGRPTTVSLEVTRSLGSSIRTSTEIVAIPALGVEGEARFAGWSGGQRRPSARGPRPAARGPRGR